MNMLEAALDHASKGHFVFPTHSVLEGSCTCNKPDCSSPGKHPIITGWQGAATTDPTKIRAWWAQWPWANIGIAMGPSRLIVLDVDVSETKDGRITLARLEREYHALPKTYTVRTGSGGLHYYFAANGTVVKNSVGGLGEGLDIKSDGGYVIAPPSRHISGNCYTVEHQND